MMNIINGLAAVPPRSMGNAGNNPDCSWGRHVDATLRHRALQLFLHCHPCWHGDVHHRQPFSGVTMAQIRIENVRKDFGSFNAVKSSTFTIEDGEFFMLLGPSGCGKTTTLRMMAGLELPTSGEIYIDGEEVGMKPASQRDIAFVFQMFALYPHMNVGKNISYPLRCQGMPKAQVKKKVGEIAEILGITDILKKPVGGSVRWRPSACGLGPCDCA